MRLLECGKLELVDVRDDDIPPYAILSHTWGEDEITLQELQHMNRKVRLLDQLDKHKRAIAEKAGYVKVRNAANLATKRGFSFIWVDTCCIDKSSSAELSEAINSMFVWYQNAAECYAYLADVPPAKDEDWAWPSSTMRSSRWFTRGWTLQELVAPKKVHFYARDWSFLGHKDGPEQFQRIVSEVTGIPAAVLDGRTDPLQLSVSARMAWASRRRTTRLEDTAYCLMGLFEVNMPLLYGEGSRAFTRLQEEIIQRSDDQSIYAWNSYVDDELDEEEEDPDALSGLLAKSPAQFRDAGGLQPLPPLPMYASAPSAITNQGLRVQLYLRPILESDYRYSVPMEEDFWAILDCVVRLGDDDRCPAIRLRRLSEDQYGRLQTRMHRFFPVRQTEYGPEFENFRVVYVRQQPVYYHLPQLRLDPLHLPSDTSERRSPYRLAETCPSRQWNSATMTMQVKYSRKLQGMGLFRFHSPFSINDTVDVIVGLRRLNAKQWEGWCLQVASRGKPPEIALLDVNNQIARFSAAAEDASAISADTLRATLGEDKQLATNAILKGVQMQGRLYISVLLSAKPEIFSVRELRPYSRRYGLGFPQAESLVRVPLLRDFQVRTLTSPCEQKNPTGVKCLHDASMKSDEGDDGVGFEQQWFRKPLYDFIATVRQRRALGAELLEDKDVIEELAIASFQGDVEQMEQLLAMSPDLSLRTSDLYGLPPLHWAVASGSIRAMETLLKHHDAGLDVLATTKDGLSAVHITALCGEVSIIEVITFTHTGGFERWHELFTLHTAGAGATALHLAAAYTPHTKEGLRFFTCLARGIALDYGPMFARDENDATPLHWAAAADNSYVVQYLASWLDNRRVDDVDRYGRSALWYAAANGACKAIQALLTENASVDMADDLGRTPLHAACRGGHGEAASLLLGSGHARQGGGTALLNLTPLDYAALFGHESCIAVLLLPIHKFRWGQKAMATAAQRERALHLAAANGHVNCVRLLARVGTSPGVKFEYHLRLDAEGQHAGMVQQESYAMTVAVREGHDQVLSYFNDGDSDNGLVADTPQNQYPQLQSALPVGSSGPPYPGGTTEEEPDSPASYGEARPFEEFMIPLTPPRFYGTTDGMIFRTPPPGDHGYRFDTEGPEGPHPRIYESPPAPAVAAPAAPDGSRPQPYPPDTPPPFPGRTYQASSPGSNTGVPQSSSYAPPAWSYQAPASGYAPPLPSHQRQSYAPYPAEPQYSGSYGSLAPPSAPYAPPQQSYLSPAYGNPAYNSISPPPSQMYSAPSQPPAVYNSLPPPSSYMYSAPLQLPVAYDSLSPPALGRYNTLLSAPPEIESEGRQAGSQSITLPVYIPNPQVSTPSPFGYGRTPAPYGYGQLRTPLGYGQTPLGITDPYSTINTSLSNPPGYGTYSATLGGPSYQAPPSSDPYRLPGSYSAHLPPPFPQTESALQLQDENGPGLVPWDRPRMTILDNLVFLLGRLGRPDMLILDESDRGTWKPSQHLNPGGWVGQVTSEGIPLCELP